jgi:hypothetical protein
MDLEDSGDTHMRARLHLVGLITALTVLGAASPARADFTLAIGTKWTPINYTMPVSTTGAGNTSVLSGWNTTNLNNYLGFFFLGGSLGFQVGLDLGYSTRKDEIAGMKTDLSFTQFGFSVGGKFYLTKPRGGKVAPYLYLDFFKYFANVTTSATVPKGYENFVGGLASPLGINAAVGAEYFFTPGFSIGAEVLGLRYAFAEGSFPGVGGIGGASDTKQTNHYVTFYTGLSLNYRWDIQVQARARDASDEPVDEIESPRPRKKKKDAEPAAEPASGEPPPASPESVD